MTRAQLDGRVLVLGYGNPARLDDGLGPAFCRALRTSGWADHASRDVRVAMQLHVEHAAEVADYDHVVFVDATLPAGGAFDFTEIEPGARHAEFTTHSASPAGILALAHGLFDSRVRGHALGIRGRDFGGFGEVLGTEAQNNLGEALRFFLQLEAGAGPRAAAPVGAEWSHG